MNEIDFINAKMNRQNVPIPQFLYKYRPFDEHTFDMLDNAYVYLCPAERLDDPSECKVDFTVQDFYDLKTNRLTFKGVEMILSYIKPYTTEENFQQVIFRLSIKRVQTEKVMTKSILSICVRYVLFIRLKQAHIKNIKATNPNGVPI